MSPKATEGVGSTGRDLLLKEEDAGAPRGRQPSSAAEGQHPVEPTPSGLPAISPSRGEIPPSPAHTPKRTSPPMTSPMPKCSAGRGRLPNSLPSSPCSTPTSMTRSPAKAHWLKPRTARSSATAILPPRAPRSTTATTPSRCWKKPSTPPASAAPKAARSEARADIAALGEEIKARAAALGARWRSVHRLVEQLRQELFEADALARGIATANGLFDAAGVSELKVNLTTTRRAAMTGARAAAPARLSRPALQADRLLLSFLSPGGALDARPALGAPVDGISQQVHSRKPAAGVLALVALDTASRAVGGALVEGQQRSSWPTIRPRPACSRRRPTPP